MNTKGVLLIIAVFVVLSLAQDQKLSLRNAILGAADSLKIETIRGLQWIPGSDRFVYKDSLAGVYGLIMAPVRENAPQMLLAIDTLNDRLWRAGSKKVTRFPAITWQDNDKFWFFSKKDLIQYDLSANSVELVNRVDEDAAEARVEPSTMRVAYTVDKNLFISDNVSTQRQITFDDEDGISNGSSYVHRAEFGINNGIFWSPGGNYLAYYHLDQRPVSQYPLVHVDEMPAKMEMIRYPFAGQTSEQVSIHVYNLATSSTTTLQTGEPKDQYLPSVTWSPDEKYIYVVHLNRDQNHLRLVTYDPISGMPLRTLFEEKNDKWVEPDHGPIFWKNESGRFIWFSKKDGYTRLYLFSAKGKQLRALSPEKRDVNQWLGYSDDGEYGFYTAASGDGLERHGYRVKLSNGKHHKLTQKPGIHSLLFAGSGNYVIDRFNNLTIPNRIDLLDGKGTIVRNLLSASDPLKDYRSGKIQLLKLNNDESIELNARMITPPDFDPEKKYPAVIYVYGGPHGQMVRNSYLRGWPLWFQYMAQQGFIVFTLDNRGTNNRGLAFEQAVHRRLGTVEIADQMVGVKYLKKQSFVDTSRIGVHGWSYGGFMTISMLTRQPGVFKVGVAGGPVIDWRYYEVMYGERYMDTPYSNPEGYETASLFNYVNQLKGKLLIIHGTIDPVVVWQNSLRYLRKAIDAGKQLDYFVYPGDEHNMRGMDRLHLYRKISEYFLQHL